MKKKLYCTKPDCGLEAEFIRAVSELALVPVGRALTRKPIAVARNFLARCPVHGDIVVQTFGHHVSMGWGRRKSTGKVKH